MRRFRALSAVTLIAALLISILIESPAHAGTAACMHDHCGALMPEAKVAASEITADTHKHSVPEHETAPHKCCDQLLCQVIALSGARQPVYPFGLQIASWPQTEQRAALTGPGTLDRPPNS